MQIKNFAKIEYITAFELTKHEGTHSRLNFSASIAEDAAEICLNCSGKTISVAADDNAPIFFGRVESVEVENLNGAVRVHASCVSLSVLADENSMTRLFNNPDKKISDVLSTARLSLESSSLKISPDFAGLKYSPVVLQNQETNFKFIARIARNFGRRLWVVDTKQPADFLIDSCVEKSARKIDRNQIISMRRAKNSLTIATQNFLTLGQTVTVEGDAREMVIVGLSVRLEHETFIYRYELAESKLEPPKIPDAPFPAKTVKLHAKVKSAKDPKNLGRLQLSFDNKFLEDMDAQNPLWIPYRAPYTGKNGGVVFIPDEGDAVEVFFTNEEVFCAAALRENPLAEECKNVAEKFIGNNFRQRIFWREKSLELHSGDYKILMNEKGIELVVGENSIALSEQGILLKTKDSQISLAKDAAIHAAGKFELKASDAEIKASSKTKIDGSEISVSSSGAANVKAGGTLKLAGSTVELC